MKNLFKSRFHLLLLLMACSPLARAMDHEVRNGGEAVPQGDVLRLRDLFASTNCTWVLSSDLRQSLPEYPRIMEGLKGPAPRFQGTFERRAPELSFCFTDSPLLKVDTRDFDSAQVDALLDGQSLQVAVKIKQEVFIDRALFERMPPRDRALLYIHENLHNLIAATVGQRNQRLRTFVKFIDDCSAGRVPCDQTSFGFQMRQSGLSPDLLWEVNNYVCGLAAGFTDVARAQRDCDAKFFGLSLRWTDNGSYYKKIFVDARVVSLRVLTEDPEEYGGIRILLDEVTGNLSMYAPHISKCSNFPELKPTPVTILVGRFKKSLTVYLNEHECQVNVPGGAGQ